jgi:hypothetical protein
MSDATSPQTRSGSPLPQGYRQGIVTAITVFLGFSLAYIRFWGIERPGVWTWKDILSGVALGIGILVQLWSLFRALDVRDDDSRRYSTTVRWFFCGVIIVIASVVASIFLSA